MPGIEKPQPVQTYLGGMVKCAACYGAGVISPANGAPVHICRDCKGSGLVEPPETMKLYREPDTKGEW